MHIFVPFTLHSRSSLVFWLASFFSPACSLRFISWPKTFRCICNSVSLCLVVLCPQSSSLNEASARTMVERSVNVKNTHSMGFNVDNTSQEHLQKEGKKKKNEKTRRGAQKKNEKIYYTLLRTKHLLLVRRENSTVIGEGWGGGELICC